MTDSQRRDSLTVVVPVFNEVEVLATFHRRLVAAMETLQLDWDVLYVNDGSTDGSLELVRGLRVGDVRVGIVDLSRNFGKEAAMTAGLDHVRADAAVVIDADLQDPPEFIGELVRHWRDGYDVVYAQRSARDGESGLKRFTAFWFYRLIQRTTNVRIPVDTGDFRLLSRRALDSLKQLRETHRFMKGLFAWIGHPQKAVPYRREPRYAGRTKFDYWRLWNFAIEGFTSFTIAPLKIATYMGGAIAGFAFIYAVWIIIKTLLHGDPVPGYPSLMVVILMLGGVQLVTIGVLGEYVGRMFNETKRRPLYLMNEFLGPSTAATRLGITEPGVSSARAAEPAVGGMPDA